MIYKFLYVICFSLISLYVNGQKSEQYVIKGTLPDHSSDGIYVTLSNVTLPYEKTDILDSAKIKNGKFILKGRSGKAPFLANISLSGRSLSKVVLEPGKINVSIFSFNYVSRNIRLSGTPLNDAYYRKVIMPCHAAYVTIDSLLAAKHKAEQENTWTVDNEINFQTALTSPKFYDKDKQHLEFLCNHLQYPDVIIPELYTYYHLMPEEIEKIISQLPAKDAERIHKTEERLRQEVTQYLKENPPRNYIENLPEKVQVGKPFLDFKGKTIDNDTITLSDLVKQNKLVLLDFWASWCGPCLKEMPVISGIYREYKNQGLEILGISSDNNFRSWKNAIDKHNMAWLQIRSDGEQHISQLYDVKLIPYTILIDQEGNIAARNLQGEELKQKIKDLLNRK